MKKSTSVILLLLSVLLIGVAIFTVVVVDNESLATNETDSEKLSRLMADVGVREILFNIDPLEVKLMNTAGRYVRLDDFRGKIVFLNFWTTWCPTCRIEMPSMEKLHQKLSDKDFAMVTVNIKEPASQVRQFVKDFKLTFTTLLDLTGEVSTEFGIRSIPTTFILDKSGNAIGIISGPREWDSRKSIALFEHLADADVRLQRY